MELPYTTDEQFNELEDKDMAVEIVGYVDEVIAAAEVGQGKKYLLFKFILTNGSKRIMCLMWGAELIRKYEQEISVNKIIHIDGGHCKAILSTFHKTSQNLLPFEIIIQKNTVVNHLGIHQVISSHEDVPISVDFDSITNASGLICINGYVKTVFASSHTRNETMSFGSGAITNGTHKINVQIVKFGDANIFKKGDYVTITGIIKNSGVLISIICKDMTHIIKDDTVPKMPLRDLIKGVRTPKRQHSD